MAELDKKLDARPTEKDIAAIVMLQIRNKLCFQELEYYSRKGRFLFKHPLLTQFSERVSLTDLLRRDPAQFLEEYRNASNNVSRYQSFLNRKDQDPKQVDAWKVQLKKHQERLELITEILVQNGNNQCLQSGEPPNCSA